MEWAWLIPVFCFVAAPIIVVSGKFLPGKGSSLSILAIGAGFVVFWVVLANFLDAGASTKDCFSSADTGSLTCHFTHSWFHAGELELLWGIIVDPLAVVMLGLVTFVVLMVQIYSLGYMGGDPRFGWYFAVHSLFAAAMLTLVLADNFLLPVRGLGTGGYMLVLAHRFLATRDRRPKKRPRKLSSSLA